MREKIKAHLEELIQQVKEKYPGSIRLRRIFEIDGVSVPVVYIRKVFVDDISAEEGIEVASLYHNWPKWGCAIRAKRFVKTVKRDISIDAVVDHIAMWIDTHKERDK